MLSAFCGGDNRTASTRTYSLCFAFTVGPPPCAAHRTFKGFPNALEGMKLGAQLVAEGKLSCTHRGDLPTQLCSRPPSRAPRKAERFFLRSPNRSQEIGQRHANR